MFVCLLNGKVAFCRGTAKSNGQEPKEPRLVANLVKKINKVKDL
jgi:hypothetical protein